MEILDKLEVLKHSMEDEEKRKIRYQGRLEAKLESLKEYGLNSIKDAKKHIKVLEKDLDKGNDLLTKMIKDFEEDYPELLVEVE